MPVYLVDNSAFVVMICSKGTRSLLVCGCDNAPFWTSCYTRAKVASPHCPDREDLYDAWYRLKLDDHIDCITIDTTISIVADNILKSQYCGLQILARPTKRPSAVQCNFRPAGTIQIISCSPRVRCIASETASTEHNGDGLPMCFLGP